MEKYLPLGSVVRLKGGTKIIMIYGRRQLSVKTQKMYDYVACLYPEGNINENYTFMFNHGDIEEIAFLGFSSDADTEFQKVLLEADKKV
jgi:hypothetical protein